METNQLTVLLVDDNQQYVKRMVSLLSEVERIKELKTAGGYEEAQRALEAGLPDVVLLDIHLNDRSGIDLLKEIRAKDRKCTVIMISNQADDYYQQQCRELGASYFLDKTNEFQLVPDLIRTLCTTQETL